VGCGDFFTAQRPARHICNFRTRGFPILDGDGAFLEHMQPCGVQYHAGCVRAGPPFETRLEGGKGLTMPTLPVEPSFVCELCQVRAIVGRELRCTSADIQLLCFERVRLIDFRCSWQHSTLKKYGTYLRYLDAFGSRYGARVLKPTLYAAPPTTESIPLHWAQLNYSLRTNRKGERIKYGTIRPLRSAANMYYMVENQVARPAQAMKVKNQVHFFTHVSPPDQALVTFCNKGMERRHGSKSKPSWALSYVHIKWINDCLESAWEKNRHSPVQLHNICMAGVANLEGYLGWLRASECFEKRGLHYGDFYVVTPPRAGATRGLPPNVGTVEVTLLEETKNNHVAVADVVVAYTTLSGLSLGRWVDRLRDFTPHQPGRLFSSPMYPEFNSAVFRVHFAWPLLHAMKLHGEPTLQNFGDAVGTRIRDHVYSFHSWRRAGRSRVSRAARHNEPCPPGSRQASSQEIYEHARWEAVRSNRVEDMPSHYNQWELIDRVALTLCCM